MPKKIKAGKLSGPSHKKGGILLDAEGGEYIIKKSSVKKIGKRALDKVNKEGKLPEENKMPKSKYKKPGTIETQAHKGIEKEIKDKKKEAKMFGKPLSEVEEGVKKGVEKVKEEVKKHKANKKRKKMAELIGEKAPSPKKKKKNLDKSPKKLIKGHRTFKGGRETTMDKYYKGGGKVGDSIKTYSSGGYVEGE